MKPWPLIKLDLKPELRDKNIACLNYVRTVRNDAFRIYIVMCHGMRQSIKFTLNQNRTQQELDKTWILIISKSHWLK